MSHDGDDLSRDRTAVCRIDLGGPIVHKSGRRKADTQALLLRQIWRIG